MAVSSRSMTRQRDYSKLLIALAVLAGVMAIAPILAAAGGLVGASPRTRTAFASAPAGEYAVLGRSEGASDVISVASASSPGAVTEVARIPRLEGFASSGAVSPDGRELALVTVDGGTKTRPVASLKVVNLETGKVVTAAREIAAEQLPIWSSDGAAVIVTRFAGAGESQTTIDLVSASADGSGEKRLKSYRDVLGVYPIGHDSGGALVTVFFDSRGSILQVEGEESVLSANLTRDWRLSPDGSELAFIDVDTSAGTRYLARTARIGGSGLAVAALTADVSALGTAWNPATRQPTFGVEPGQGAFSRSTQALSTGDSATGPLKGFDVPQAYSKSGDALLVTRWSGSTFENPGEPVLELVASTGRSAYENYTRFYGWSAR